MTTPTPSITRTDLPDGVAAKIGVSVPLPLPTQLDNASACIRLMHVIAVELDAQAHAPLGSFPLSLATLVLNSDGTVSTGWSATTDLAALHHLMWACETLRQRLAAAIDAKLATQEEDASPSPSDTPPHDQEPAHSPDQ